MLKKLFAICPAAEVLARRMYKSGGGTSRLGKRFFQWYRREDGKTEASVSISQLGDSLKRLGIKAGDMLLVHSSMKGLQSVCASPGEIIRALLELLGPEGTLVMPAFPYYKKDGPEEGSRALDYDPKKTLAWTGILPNVFLTVKGTRRSRYPNNSLAANGRYAQEMFARELEGERSHGEGSAWNFCAEHHAKVLFLGVKPDHALSEIHLGEDLLGDDWPIKDWYYRQKYRIREKDTWKEKECLVRRSFWTRYLTEEYCVRRLKRAGMLSEPDSLCRGYMPDLYVFREWLLSENRKGNLIFYRIPGRYWKRAGET